MEIKDRLRELRLNFTPSMTQDELAAKLHISRSTIGMYESGRRVPKREHMEAIADLYNVDLDYLYCRSDKTTNISTYPSHKYAYYTGSSAADVPITLKDLQQLPFLTLPDICLDKHAGNKNIIFIHAIDNSMNRVFPNGSLLAILPTELIDLKNGDIVVFEDEAQRLSIKRYFRYDSLIVFKPDSTDEAFYDRIYKAEENKIRIIGRVITYVVTL